MRNSKTNTGTSKKTQDLIFATVVFVGAVLVFMFIFSATRNTHKTDKPTTERALSPDHEETRHVGNNISPEELEKSTHENAEEKKLLPYGETKWNKKKVKRKTETKPSTYEREEKVVRPEKTGGVL